MKGSFSASHEDRTQLRAFTDGYSKGITIKLSIINSNNKVASSTYARPDDTLSLFSFKFDAGDVLENFTVKAMLTDEVDTEYEEYGAMPSLEYTSKIKTVGQDVNIFDKDNVNVIENAFINSATMKIENVVGRRCFYVPCKPNRRYSVLRKKVGQAFAIGTTATLPIIESAIVDINVKDDEFETIETSSNANYLVVYYRKRNTEVDEDILNNIKIVEGTETNGYSTYGYGSANVVVYNKNVLPIQLKRNNYSKRNNNNKQ